MYRKKILNGPYVKKIKGLEKKNLGGSTDVQGFTSDSSGVGTTNAVPIILVHMPLVQQKMGLTTNY